MDGLEVSLTLKEWTAITEEFRLLYLGFTAREYTECIMLKQERI